MRPAAFARAAPALPSSAICGVKGIKAGIKILYVAPGLLETAGFTAFPRQAIY